MYDFEWFTCIQPKTAFSAAVTIVQVLVNQVHIAFGAPVYV